MHCNHAFHYFCPALDDLAHLRQESANETPELDAKGRPIRKSRGRSLDLKAMFEEEEGGEGEGDEGEVERWAEALLERRRTQGLQAGSVTSHRSF